MKKKQLINSMSTSSMLVQIQHTKNQEEDSGKTYASYLNEINNKTAFINPTNHNEIELELLSLNQTKSCGYDEISPKSTDQQTTCTYF